MASELQPQESAPRASSTCVHKMGRLAVVGVILAVVVAGFFYLGGWLTPDDLTPKKFVDAFEAAGGVHPGFRRNHAKGVCVSGYFDSNGNGAEVCRASVFLKGRAQVVGRFSLGGGMPSQADTPEQVRGLGLQLTTGDGEIWRTAMVNLAVFPLATPQAFYENLVASVPDPTTGKPDPEKMKAFAAAHPETVAAIGVIMRHPPSSGFGDSEFHGENVFMFTNAQGQTVPIRWVFVPVETFQSGNSSGANYLFDGLIAQIRHGPLQWHLMLIVGQSGDPTNDATLPWPDSRRQIDAGTLTIDDVQSEDTSPIALLNFDPLVLPEGIAPSDDPLLSARSAVYSESFTRRSGEHDQKAPSAVTPAEVGEAQTASR